MTPTQDPNDRNPTDADDGVPDWDLSVGPLDESDGTPDIAPAAQASSLCPDSANLSADDQPEVTASIEPQLVAAEQALDEDDSFDAGNESGECYQGHFLEDDEPETDYVAHVDGVPHDSAPTPGGEPPGRVEVESPQQPDATPTVATSSIDMVKLAGNDALTVALVSGIGTTESHHANESIDQTSELDTHIDFGERPGGTAPGVEVSQDVEEGSTEPDSDELEESLPAATGGGWTIPLLCLGIAIVAFCMVIPQADANRRLAYERSSLRADLESVQQQVATNDEFLRKLASDPTLAERLAQRQLNLQRAGTRALAIGLKDTGTSPFDLVKVAPPPAVEPYEPVGGKLAAVCRDGRSRLYLMGLGLLVLAAGLMLGISDPRVVPPVMHE